MVWVNTSPLVKTYTLEEFWELPDPDDGAKLELIAGVLYMTPPPEQIHDTIVARINRLLNAHLIATNDKGTIYIPRAAIWTGRNTWIEPDLFYISAELKARLDPQRRTTADLVVEVISPGSAIYDRNTKAGTYGALGVRELWLIDEVTKTLEVRYQTGSGLDAGRVFSEGEGIVSRVFPDLALRIEQLFVE